MNNQQVPEDVAEMVRQAKLQAAELEWIGVDLDATLAQWHGWSPVIGEPVPEMLAKVKAALASGETVKIFTARVCQNGQTEAQRQYQFGIIRAWCRQHIGQVLEITNEKDFYMRELWDDRAKQVLPNRGIFLEDVLAQMRAAA